MRSVPWGAVLTLVLSTTVANAAESKVAVLPTQFEESARGMVPKLFDDYVLTAVQNTSQAEVIGQDDINALIGFDQQKSLLGCDDMSCMADIGGALGVDKLIVIKIARLEQDWIATAKLINIREARVEQRASEFVRGDVKALLTGVPGIVGKLFGSAPAAMAEPVALEPAPLVEPTPQSVAPQRRPPALQARRELEPDPRLGRGSRVMGLILGSVGLATAVIGSAYLMTTVEDDYCDYWDECSGYGVDYTNALAGASLSGLGLGLLGWGSGLYVNGRARAASGDGEATGRVWYRWMAWTLMGVATAWPLITGSFDNPELVWTGAVAATAGSSLLFTLSAFSSSAYAVTATGREVPIAGMTILRDGDHVVPGARFALAF